LDASTGTLSHEFFFHLSYVVDSWWNVIDLFFGRTKILSVASQLIFSAENIGIKGCDLMEGMHIEPGTVTLPIFGGITVTDTVIVTWIVMAVLILFALIVRFFLLKSFTEVPKGLQNVIELAVEVIESFSKSTVSKAGETLAPYFFTIAFFVVSAFLVELFGLRPPTADLSMTVALSLMTFILINYFGFRHKGFVGRLKSYTKPMFIIAPIKVLTDLAVPVSLSCRLFGNTLGGLIIMDLIYVAVPFVIPAFLSIYFNLFHAAVQTFIFITLSLTFIGEAIE